VIDRSATSAEPSQPRSFQFRLLDVAILVGLNAVAIVGTIEIYRASRTDRNPMCFTRVSSYDADQSPPAPRKPEEPARLIVVGDGVRFTPFWFRQFAVWLAFNAATILLSFFLTAYLVKKGNQHIRHFGPRLAAAFACLLCLTSLTFGAYQSNPHWYEVAGRIVNEPVTSGFRAIGMAAVATCAIATIEISSYLLASRRV